MKIKKNKKGTFDITEVSLGKLMAIVSAIEKLEKNSLSTTSVQDDVKNIINNNSEYQKALKGE